MRSLILASFLIAGSALGLTAAEGAPAGRADNTVCICGKAADAARAPVTITVQGKTHVIAVCSDECAKAAQADPKKAVAAVEAHNKRPAAVK